MNHQVRLGKRNPLLIWLGNDIPDVPYALFSTQRRKTGAKNKKEAGDHSPAF
jgi:hypothetical protein